MPLLKHGDLKMSQSLAIEAYLLNIAPKFKGLTAKQRAVDGMFASIKEEMLLNCAKVIWVANKKLEISNFNFKFPRARNIEIIRYYRQTLQGSFSAVYHIIYQKSFGCIKANICK